MSIKRLLAAFIMLSTLVGCVCSCGAGYTLKEECHDCKSIPTKKFHNSVTKEDEYYCESCATKCAFCGKKATKENSTAFGIAFTCSDCYKELEELGDSLNNLGH